MKKKIYWLSRHELSPAQKQALTELHGEAEVIQLPIIFKSPKDLATFIQQHDDGFTYAVAGAPHYIYAVLAGCEFGIFENHPVKRQDGFFGLAAVYHVVGGKLKKVWVNPDPLSDQGEILIPVKKEGDTNEVRNL